MGLRVAILLLLIVVSGCTQYRWTHPSFTESAWRRDTYECERDMRQSAYFGGGIGGAIAAANFQERCLQARGYNKEAIN